MSIFKKDKIKKPGIWSGLAGLVFGKKAIDDNLLEEIETRLLTADVGVEATEEIISELSNAGDLVQNLQSILIKILEPCEKLLIIPELIKPYVILMVGVNGSGKTTTIGKLAKRLQKQGKKVMLAAGDTFRAAAIEQLKVWGERNNIPVISQESGADSAAVIYDATQAAQARGFDVLIADTAGRLHTQSHLMEELKKVKKVIAKLDTTAPHEVMLVLDASIGQNALVQAQQFNEALTVTGITLTKMDGTAKGGIIFSIAKNLEIPVRFIGVGEGIDDLHPFNAQEFVSSLFKND
jgi:fused signal recognition particle receptor